jgi:fibronectin-binding autotransporter adhesin
MNIMRTGLNLHFVSRRARTGGSPRLNRLALLLACVAVTGPARLAVAQATWDGGGADANWATAANWVGDATPTFNNTLDVIFNTAGAGNLTNWLGASRTIRSLTFNADADNAIGVSFTTNGNTGAQTLTMGNTTDGATITVASGAAGNIALGSGANGQSLALAGNLAIDHAGGGTLTTRAISGSFGVTKNGAGTWSMGSRANSFSGGLTVNAGTVTLSTGSTAGSNAFGGGLTVTGGSVTFAASSVVDFTGGLTVTGGTLSAATAATYTGDTSISIGRVAVSVDNALSSGTLTLGSGAVLATDSTRRTLANPIVISSNVQLGETGSRLTLSGPIDLGNSTRTLTVENNPTNGNFATALSGVISGTAGIVKQGSGILDLENGGNTFTGDVSLNDGTLRLRTNAIGNAANKVIVNGTGSVALANVGAQVLSLSNAVDVNANFSLNAGGAVTLSGALNLGGATRTITLGGAQAKSLNGVISNGGLALVVDAGTVNLGGANTFSGDTTVAGTVGVVNLTNSLALQNSTLAYAAAGGSVAFNGITAATFGGLSGDKALALANTGSAAVALSVGNNDASTAYSGVLSGAGSLTKVGSGTLTLGAANTYAGQTVISAGTLALGAAGSIADSVGIFLSSATTGLDVSAASGGGITIGTGKGVGGLGTITGNLSLDTGAGLILSSQALIGNQPLTVTGAASLPNSFGIASLVGTTGQPFNFGLLTDGTYSLIANASDFSNISNWGAGQAANVGPGRTAYFSQPESGGLQITVVPEPSVMLLGLGAVALAAWRLRRRGS